MNLLALNNNSMIKNMFKNLLNFSLKRNGKEAFGFYLAYLLVALLLNILIGGLYAGPMNNYAKEFSQDQSMNNLINILFCLSIFILILKEKKLHKSYAYLLLILLTGILAVKGGALLGLILPAIFTTKPVNK